MLTKLLRYLRSIAVVAFAAGVLTFLYEAWQINLTGARDRAQNADVVVVLGALVEADGRPGPDLSTRTLHAVSLYQRGLAPVLVCSGGYENDPLSAAAVARRLAIQQGIPAARVLRADGSMTTREEAASVRALMEAHGWQSAILVSHPLHLERARLLFQGQGLTVYTSPTSTELSAIPLSSRTWLTLREAGGIILLGLEQVGVPYEWTRMLSRSLYGRPAASGAN